MHLPNNTLLQGGKYRIVRFISAGGFGCTYEAMHVMLGKRVAIKEFFVKDFCNRDDSTSHVTVGTQSKVALVSKLKRKFLEEAIALSKFHNENIVQVTDVFEENGTAYYVMDYINGKSIQDILKTENTIAESRAVKYICQVANALKYVHSQNRLHLDIKPGNIMIDEHDNAILIDFGTSKQYDEEDGENTSTLLGKTPGYAPIEQMGNSVQTFTPATDIYSLGATLYKMLSGNTPPEANILVADDESLKPLPSYISAETRNAVEQAMKVKRKDRPQSVGEFVSILNGDGGMTIIDMSKSEQKMPKEQPTSTTKGVKPKQNNNRRKKRTINFKWPALAIATVILIFIIARIYNSSVIESQQDLAEVNTSQKEYVTNTTCKDAKGRNFKYTGQTEQGIPNGEGVGIYDYGTYSGEYRAGTREGKGKFTSKDGTQSFDGTFTNDEYANGTITISDGSKYIGTFKNGQPYNGEWYNPDGSFNSQVINGQ